MKLKTLVRFFILFAVICVGGSFLFVPLASAEDKGTPKFTVGKQYHAIYACTKSPAVDSVGDLHMIPGCYEEFWTILAVGKGGWLLVVDLQSDQVWWANVNRLQAVREMVKKGTEPPPSHEEVAPNTETVTRR